jgi:hypothetical protein
VLCRRVNSIAAAPARRGTPLEHSLVAEVMYNPLRQGRRAAGAVRRAAAAVHCGRPGTMNPDGGGVREIGE